MEVLIHAYIIMHESILQKDEATARFLMIYHITQSSQRTKGEKRNVHKKQLLRSPPKFTATLNTSAVLVILIFFCVFSLEIYK